MFVSSAPVRVLLLALAISCFACSREPQGQVRDVRAEAATTAAQRMQGRWVLASFEPETPLEPVLAMLLQDQINKMVIDVDGQNIAAHGPGVTVYRTFRISEAYLDHFTAMVFDSYGVGVQTICDFSGNMLLVTGATAPWRGRASFRRAQS